MTAGRLGSSPATTSWARWPDGSAGSHPPPRAGPSSSPIEPLPSAPGGDGAEQPQAVGDRRDPEAEKGASDDPPGAAAQAEVEQDRVDPGQPVPGDRQQQQRL